MWPNCGGQRAHGSNTSNVNHQVEVCLTLRRLLVSCPRLATTKIYGCEVRRRNHLERKEGGGFDPADYDQFPSRYISTFSKKIAPYASVIINGIYWAVDSPKLLTLPDAKYLLRPANTPWIPSSVGSPALPHRMLAICDISADPGGSIEFMNECTTIDTPFCLYDADRNKDSKRCYLGGGLLVTGTPLMVIAWAKTFKGPGVLVCSIDNMPTQLPLESTDFFGEMLYPYALDILQSDALLPLEQHNFLPAVHGAIIASNGKLTPNFEYIQELRTMSTRSWHKAGSPREGGCRRIVLLGAGYVSAPVVQYLHKEHNVHITIASALKDEADAIASVYQQSVEPVLLDVLERPDTLQDLVSSADVVVSLLPSPLHHLVAECCIEQGVHMVTASYCTKKMMELHERAVEAGVTIVNEVGLDPGIDHLLAMECIDEVHQAGGKVESFVSYCGGLPAPEYSDNALRYKFSWNPKGVLLNTLSTAKYINNGQEIIIPGGGQLMKEAHKLKFLPGFDLEGFPNRDSTHYASFCDTVQGMQSLGLFDTNPHPALHPKGPEITWELKESVQSAVRLLDSPMAAPSGAVAVSDLGTLLSCTQRQLVCNLLGQSDSTIFYENLKRQLQERVGGSGTFRVEALESLGLLEDIHVIKMNTPLDTLSHFLSKRLAMEPHDRDLVILTHEIGILWPDGSRELRGIHLVSYGEPGCTAMSRAVGIPTAIAAKMVLDGEIQKKGMVLPFTPDIYRPMLSRLKTEGLAATEKSRYNLYFEKQAGNLHGQTFASVSASTGPGTSAPDSVIQGQEANESSSVVRTELLSFPEYLITFKTIFVLTGIQTKTSRGSNSVRPWWCISEVTLPPCKYTALLQERGHQKEPIGCLKGGTDTTLKTDACNATQS
uniref:(California timema) hypothetical protein n=1 Tax=Timema californicum TaxID=61474 RepID=A0A7R9P9F2_TIMCA|nr:unnamed protein product [Timema californicum]